MTNKYIEDIESIYNKMVSESKEQDQPMKVRVNNKGLMGSKSKAHTPKKGKGSYRRKGKYAPSVNLEEQDDESLTSNEKETINDIQNSKKEGEKLEPEENDVFSKYKETLQNIQKKLSK